MTADLRHEDSRDAIQFQPPNRVIVAANTVDAIMGAPEFPGLIAEYAAESATPGLPTPDARMNAYRHLEAVGMLHAFGAFEGTVLVGFISFILPVLLHYGVGIAVSESFFVTRTHRSSGAGLRLLRAAENKVRELGSPGFFVSAPFEGDLFRVLPRMGYVETSRTFFKKVSE